jgi:hypothetical protein
MKTTRITTLAIALTLLALPALASAQDLRMPDTRDAAAPPAQTQDLRSPDTRDAADPFTTLAPVDIAAEPAAPPQAAPVEIAAAGTDWTMLVLVGGAFLLAVAAVVALTTVRGRRRVAA